MFAEKVFDGGFEGVPEYRVAFRQRTDRLGKAWYPDGAVHRGEFERDTKGRSTGAALNAFGNNPAIRARWAFRSQACRSKAVNDCAFPYT